MKRTRWNPSVENQIKWINEDMNEKVILLNVNCNKCNKKEVWSINELDLIQYESIGCLDCLDSDMDITLNNKWGE